MKEELAGLLAIILGCVVVALLLTGINALNFRSDCHRDGGTFHASPTTLTCAY